MSMQNKRAAFLGGLFIVGFVIGAEPVAMAGFAAHWPREWNEAAYGDVDYYVASDDPAPFDTSTANSEMGFGRNTWNNISGTPVLVDYGGTLAMSSIPCTSAGLGSVPSGRAYAKGCSISDPGLYWAAVIAGTNLIDHVWIVLDSTPSGYTWHVSSSTTVPAGKKDLRGATAHELGHVLGALEIDIGDCATASAQTMCPFHSDGTSKYRSAQTHESTDFKDQYATP